MKKILILGGTRYVGKAFLQQLLTYKGVDVDVLSRRELSGFETVIGNRKDQDLLKNLVKRNYDVIIDFIGYCLPDAQKLINALKLGNFTPKIIFISSTYVYDIDQEKQFFKEEDFNPNNYDGNLLEREMISYEEGKRSAESFYSKNYIPEKLCILRFPIILGEEDYTKRTHFFSTFFDQGGCLNQLIHAGRSNYIFVEDIKDLLSLLLIDFKAGIFNFSRPEELNQYELAVLFHSLLKYRIHKSCQCCLELKTPFYYPKDFKINNQKVHTFFEFDKSFKTQLKTILNNESCSNI